MLSGIDLEEEENNGAPAAKKKKKEEPMNFYRFQRLDAHKESKSCGEEGMPATSTPASFLNA